MTFEQVKFFCWIFYLKYQDWKRWRTVVKETKKQKVVLFDGEWLILGQVPVFIQPHKEKKLFPFVVSSGTFAISSVCWNRKLVISYANSLEATCRKRDNIFSETSFYESLFWRRTFWNTSRSRTWSPTWTSFLCGSKVDRVFFSIVVDRIKWSLFKNLRTFVPG